MQIIRTASADYTKQYKLRVVLPEDGFFISIESHNIRCLKCNRLDLKTRYCDSKKIFHMISGTHELRSRGVH